VIITNLNHAYRALINMYHRGSTSKPSIIYFSRSSRYNVIHETQLIFKELYIHYSPLLHLDATYLRVETQKHMVFHLFLFLYLLEMILNYHHLRAHNCHRKVYNCHRKVYNCHRKVYNCHRKVYNCHRKVYNYYTDVSQSRGRCRRSK
jgi:hypothetical protein